MNIIYRKNRLKNIDNLIDIKIILLSQEWFIMRTCANLIKVSLIINSFLKSNSHFNAFVYSREKKLIEAYHDLNKFQDHLPNGVVEKFYIPNLVK